MKQAYIPVEVAKLSDRQISRILNGHPVRVKHGGNHTLHLSSEQHKKLMRAHKKGSAITLVFDPFQMQEHDHIRGAGFGKLGKLVKSASNNLVKSAKNELKQHIPKAKELALKRATEAIEKFAEKTEDKLQGHGFKNLMKGASNHLVKHAKRELKQHIPKAKELALRHATQAIERYGGLAEDRLQGQGVGRFFKGVKKGFKKVGQALKPVGRVLKPIAQEFGEQLLEHGKQALLTGAMGALGGMGVKHHKRVSGRGRPRKRKSGGALMPAGYSGSGFAGIKWEDSEE